MKPTGVSMIGSTVEVVKGRSAPVGTVGVVFWARVCRYGKIKPGVYSRVTTRIGITASCHRAEDGSRPDAVWSYSDNVRILDTPLVDINGIDIDQDEPVPF